MPYAPEHKAETRTRILDSARRLFNRNGLTEISIDEIMAGAGLTRGGFYSYFGSKEELYAEAIMHFVHCRPAPSWQRMDFDAPPEGPRLARAIMAAYLSREHMQDVDGSCPMIGLATDVARGGSAAKAAYRQVLGMMVGIFSETLGPDALAPRNAPDPDSDRERALAVAALCVGGMVLARAVDDPKTADDLRAAAHRYATALAGWSEPETV
jgi:TetR/AcrR family transcriptional regulator, transcriptional repressor for nem operon